jgi:hypothetical protein
MKPRAWHLLETLQRTVRGGGWAAWAGLALVLAALALATLGTAANDARRETIAAERARLLAGAAPDGRPALSGRAQLQAFMAQFPPPQDLPAALTRVHAHADSHGLVVERTEYRPLDDAGQPLQRVLVSLPVQGSFAGLVAWLGDMLAAMPEVALESISVRRADPTLLVVDGEVRLHVYLRRQP